MQLHNLNALHVQAAQAVHQSLEAWLVRRLHRMFCSDRNTDAENKLNSSRQQII